MKSAKLLVALLICVFAFAGCGGGAASSTITDQDVFFEAYNAAAAQVGATQITEEDLAPYTENGEEKPGFIVEEGVLESNMLSFTPGQVMMASRPNEFGNFYLESEAVMMALMSIDKTEADKMVEDLFFKEDAKETQNANRSIYSKSITKNGVILDASQANGIFLLNFYQK